jgi:predicted O-methyltransferase YrrM
VKQSIERATKFWQNWLEQQPPNATLSPQPNDNDKQVYQHDLKMYYPDIHSWFGEMKMSVLESLCLAQQARLHCSFVGAKIVEIGSGTGGSMISLASGAPKAFLISVDPFLPYDEEKYDGLARNITEGNEPRFWQTAERFGFKNRTTNIKLKSTEAAAQVPDASCDLVHVDGNHSYEIVKADLERWWPKVRKNGMLIGHDYTTRFPGVIRAVKEWDQYSRIITPHGTSLFYVVKD